MQLTIYTHHTVLLCLNFNLVSYMAATPLIIVPWIIYLPLSSNLEARLSSLPLSLLSAEPGREHDTPSI